MYPEKISDAASHSLLKRMLYGIAFFILMVVCTSSYGQMYYLQYKLQTADKKPLAYDIFLNIVLSGNSSARIAFKDPVTGKDRLVKLNYVDNNFPDPDTDKVSYLMPFGNAFDENDKPVNGFIMPWFQFNKSDIFTMSGAVIKAYINKQSAPLAGSYHEVELAEIKALTKRFYGKNEAVYKGIFGIPTLPLRATEKGSNLYLIAIAATEDPNIGQTTLKDLENIQILFSDGASVLTFNFKYTEISGKNFTNQAVNDAIDKLKPRPQDIVMVYYSGHGFRYTNDVSPFPRMALVPSPDKNPDTENLSVEDVYTRVLKKGARVTIVLADCCNENYGVAPPLGEVKPYPEPLAGLPKLNIDNFRSLFLPKQRISLLACAADKTQLAAGDANLGGFFTSYTVSELRKSLYGAQGDGESSWAMIINNSKEYTRRKALTVVCKEGPCDANDRDIQTPAMKLVSGK